MSYFSELMSRPRNATETLWKWAWPSGSRRFLRRIAANAPLLDRVLVARHLRYRMREALGYDPDFRDPRTYNERLAWRILYDRNPLFPLTIDKIAVRDYVAEKVGPKVLVPLLGTYDRAADIPWEHLPSRFALKASHGWDMNLLVHDKAAVDRGAVLQRADTWLQQSHYEQTGEWGYRDIRPRLLIEELLLETDGRVPEDIKFYVFGGRVKLLRIHIDRFGSHAVNFYDTDLRLLPFRQVFPTNSTFTPLPEVRDMTSLAERLGEGFDYARVDLYLTQGQIKFGEITHYDGSACVPFIPREYDRLLGDMWGQVVGGTKLAA
jgi:hypothetical protein